MSTNHKNTIKAFEDRAAARSVAAQELQRLADRATLGLVKDELMRGVARVLAEETEFRTMAEELRKRSTT